MRIGSVERGDPPQIADFGRVGKWFVRKSLELSNAAESTATAYLTASAKLEAVRQKKAPPAIASIEGKLILE